MWVSSDGNESFTAYTGPGTASYPCIASTRTGTAVPTWQHPDWGSVTSQFTHGGTWIWEAYRAVDPICGTVVDFEETFDIPGEFTDGTLWVTADNGYEAYLNGTLLVTDGLSGDWRNSNLTESFVTTDHDVWRSVEIATWLQLTGNTLRFETANEYFNTDDGRGSAGTVDSNPGGLIYEAEITYYADGETAWGAGTRFTEDKNWATYFNYTVQEPPPPPILVVSSLQNFSGTGWGGWSCPPEYPNVIDGGVSKTNTQPFVPADYPVNQVAAVPGATLDGYTFPVFPHYTYGTWYTGETGWAVHNGGTAQNLYVYVYCGQ
jgi:hypothetical protein